MVARSPLRHVHPLGRLLRPCRHLQRPSRSPASASGSCTAAKFPWPNTAQFAKQFNPVKYNADDWVRTRQGRRHEIHRHHLQTPRRLRHVRLEGLRLEHGARRRPSGAIRCRSSPPPARSTASGSASTTRRRRTGTIPAAPPSGGTLGQGAGRQHGRLHAQRRRAAGARNPQPLRPHRGALVGHAGRT